MRNIPETVLRAGLVMVITSGLAQATPIVNWSLGKVYQATDIKNDGTLVKAADVDGGGGSGVTVNGIFFESLSLGPGVGNGTFGNNVGGQNDAALSSLFNTEQFGWISSPGTSTIVGAVPGQEYRAQILSYVSNFRHDTNVTIEGATYTGWDVYEPYSYPEANPGHMLTATWVQEAGDTTIDLFFDSTDPNAWTISGFVVHAIPEPAGLSLLLVGSLLVLARHPTRV